MPAPREITVVVGKSGSGKTQLIAKHIGPRHPRRITFDATGETRELYPAAAHVFGAVEAAQVLALWLSRRLRHWHLCIGGTAADAARVVSALCPLYDGKRYALSSAFGGVAVECFELDAFAPNNGFAGDGAGAAWRTAFLRGRHVGLSLLVATQYPALVDRAATSQAGRVITFALHEPRQLDYMRQLGGPRLAEAVKVLPPYESLWVTQSPWSIARRDRNYRLRNYLVPPALPVSG